MAAAKKKQASHSPRLARARRPRPDAPAEASAPAAAPPLAAASFTPAQSLQEIALVLHRICQNLLAIAQLDGQRAQIDTQRLEVEREQLSLARQQLEFARQAKAEVEAMKGASAEAQGFAMRLFETMLGRMGAAGEPRAASAPALPSNGEAADPEPPPRGIRVRSPRPVPGV
jgi:hypothetical protein